MATIGNNTNGKASHVRDSYFDSGEKEYLEQLLKDPKHKALHEELLMKDAETLYDAAKALMMAVELGRFDEEQMAKAELYITHLLGAIEDLERVLELKLIPSTSSKKDGALISQSQTIQINEDDYGLSR